MSGINERIFEEFFYYGIENVPELLEGIIFSATSEMHKLYKSLNEQFNTPNDIQLSQIKEIAYDLGIQYYRFIELNKVPSKLIDYKTENELDEVKQMINKTLEENINKKALLEYEVGYYYSYDEDARFSTSYIKDHMKRKHWTIEVAEQLKQLSKEEKENPIEYYRHWIITRLKNAQSRKQGRDDSEIELLENVKAQLEERIEKNNKDYENPKNSTR